MDLKTIRLSLINDREKIEQTDRKKREENLLEKIQKDMTFNSADTVALYEPIRGEIDTERIINICWNKGKKVCLPVIVGKGEMKFYLYEKDTPLLTMKYGIKEPDIARTEEVSKIDIMFIPLVGYYQNYRLGYGGNYYNNYLSKNKVGYTIGLSFKEGKLDFDFHTEKDIPLDRILSI